MKILKNVVFGLVLLLQFLPLQTFAQKLKFDGEYLFQPGMIDYPREKDKKSDKEAREFCEHISKEVFSLKNAPNALIISGSNIKFKKPNSAFNIAFVKDTKFDNLIMISPEFGMDYSANLNKNTQSDMLKLTINLQHSKKDFDCAFIFKKISP
jgi:hypothetical protein